MKKLYIAILAIAVVVAAVIAYNRPHKKESGYPGRFVYDSLYAIYSLRHSSGETVYGFKMKDNSTDTNTYTGLALSPKGNSFAYLRTWTEYVTAIKTCALDKMSEYETPSGKVKVCASPKYITYDVRKYNIPYCLLSNLEWSPDGKSIAYASNNKLYILDTVTKKIELADLPDLPNLDAILAEWHKCYTGPEVLSKYNKRHSDDDRLSPQALQIIKQAEASLYKRLGLKSSDSLLYADYHWYAMSTMNTSIDFKDRAMICRLFNYEGRTLTWISPDTIYCDNLKLNITKDPINRLQVKAAKTSLPCEFFAHPMWSPRGDKAAYLIQAYDKALQHKRIITKDKLLLIVSSSGKVLQKRYLSYKYTDNNADFRWSKDGRYIAIRYSDCSDKTEDAIAFYIFDVNTMRKWRVPCPRVAHAGLDLLWDWDLD